MRARSGDVTAGAAGDLASGDVAVASLVQMSASDMAPALCPSKMHSNVALLVGQWVLPGRQNSVRRGRKPREKSKIDQTLRSGSFEFDFMPKEPWLQKRTTCAAAVPWC